MNDPFALAPRLWFGVLCYGIATDASGQLTLQGVFNQVAFLSPPEDADVPPNAFLNAVLAVGFNEGLGNFEAEIDIRDMDGNVVWRRPEGHWSFSLGPGERNAAVLAQQVRHWFRQPGRYYFRVYLSPVQEEHQIPFEVAEKIGPGEIVPDAAPDEPTRP